MIGLFVLMENLSKGLQERAGGEGSLKNRCAAPLRTDDYDRLTNFETPLTIQYFSMARTRAVAFVYEPLDVHQSLCQWAHSRQFSRKDHRPLAACLLRWRRSLLPAGSLFDRLPKVDRP